MTEKSYVTVKTFSERHDACPEGGIRHLIFNSKSNGFDDAFVRVGRKVLIDENLFFKILREQNEVSK